MKNRIHFRLLSFSCFILLIGCSTLPSEKSSSPVELKIVEKLKPGVTTKDEVKKLLGTPQEITDFRKLSNLKDRKDLGELWEYQKGEHTQLSISFSPDSNILESWIWHVGEGEPQQDLRTTMNAYPRSHWVPEKEEYINPHYISNTCYYEDKKEGISIEYNGLRKEVFTIMRRDPSRKLASNENEKPPIFCIESSCSPGIPAKEFFKNVPISQYCKLPE